MRLRAKTGLGALAVVLTAGVLALFLWRDVRSEVAPEPAPALPARTPIVPDLAPVASTAPEDLDLLREVLAAEVAAREELAIEVDELREELAIEVDELREELASMRSERERSVAERVSRGGGFSRQRRFDEERLLEAGLDRGRAEQLREVYERSQLDFIHLRDQAIREGWVEGGGGGFAQVFEARAQQTAVLQEELGLEMYDLMLYGAGQPNRLVVRDILPGSNAEAGGLQEGDIIRTYDDQPVFGMQELRYLMAQGDRQTPVEVGVERAGGATTVQVTPGPMGVRLRPAWRQPETP